MISLSISELKEARMSSGITYENYKYTGGERKDTKLNKRIISLARRHKFYLPQIQTVINPKVSSFGFGDRQSFQIIVAKKQVRKDYKVVGFIIYDFGMGIWSRCAGKFQLGSVEYWLVDEKFRGQGIGKALYENMVEDCRECCLDNMAVMFDKTDARLCDLYTKLGFKLIKKYDGVEVKQPNDRHQVWHKIVYTKFCYGELFGGDRVVYEEED